MTQVAISLHWYWGRRIPTIGSGKTHLKSLGELRGIPHTTLTMNTYPGICHDVGLDCESCTGETAKNLAKVVKGLRGKMIGQMFVQIYTDPACSKMHAHFASSYLAAERPMEMKIPIGVERPMAMGAVA